MPGKYQVRQEEHIDDIVLEWPKTFKSTDKVLTPASNTLVEKGGGKLLCAEKIKLFHRVVAKGLFVSNCSLPNITLTISILSSREREPNRSDWGKCQRIRGYLKCTRNLHLILGYDGSSIVR